MDYTIIIFYILIGLIMGAVAGFFVALYVKKNKSERLNANLGQKDQTIGQLTKEIQNEKTERDQLSGKNKQMFVEITNLKAEKNNIFSEKERLIKEVSNFKATEDGRKKDFDDNIKKLDDAKLNFEQEMQRVRREDEEKLQKEKEERSRMWAEHEEKVKAQLIELCKTPQYLFTNYDNNNLPPEFGGRFKPDFLIEFLEQYVIFDAKVSESDLQNYINTNVKSTFEKIANSPKIYPMIFFIVPTDAIKSLKKIRFYEQGYEFFVIPPEAIEVVLTSFKKISSYELAQQLDPRDRDNIVNLIAEFDDHISMRNAIDVLAAERGVSVLKKASALKSDIKGEISLKKSTMRLQQFSPTDIKTLKSDIDVQQERIRELISPKVAIPKSNLKRVRPILKERVDE